MERHISMSGSNLQSGQPKNSPKFLAPKEHFCCIINEDVGDNQQEEDSMNPLQTTGGGLPKESLITQSISRSTNSDKVPLSDLITKSDDFD
jgi:hypothetical protein